MKVALLSESPADEAVLRVLVDAILGEPAQIAPAGYRARGWPNVLQVLPAVIRHLHFNTDVDTLVVTCDSDDTPVHTAAHDAPQYYHPHCRMCQLRAAFRQTSKRFPAAHGRLRVHRVVSVAVPALAFSSLTPLGGPRLAVARLAAPPRAVAGSFSLGVGGAWTAALPALREVERHRRDLRRLEYDFPGFAALMWDLKTAPPTNR